MNTKNKRGHMKQDFDKGKINNDIDHFLALHRFVFFICILFFLICVLNFFVYNQNLITFIYTICSIIILFVLHLFYKAFVGICKYIEYLDKKEK